jgi:hypothetical protein
MPIPFGAFGHTVFVDAMLEPKWLRVAAMGRVVFSLTRRLRLACVCALRVVYCETVTVFMKSMGWLLQDGS